MEKTWPILKIDFQGTNYQDINHIPQTLAGKWNKAFIKVSD